VCFDEPGLCSGRSDESTCGSDNREILILFSSKARGFRFARSFQIVCGAHLSSLMGTEMVHWKSKRRVLKLLSFQQHILARTCSILNLRPPCSEMVLRQLYVHSCIKLPVPIWLGRVGDLVLPYETGTRVLSEMDRRKWLEYRSKIT
jgi:hypothetical protein